MIAAGPSALLDLATGELKWKWASDGTKYASPELLTAGDTKAIVAETAGNIVAVSLADGKLLWKTPFKSRYNASTPFVDGKTVIYSGPSKGMTAVTVEPGSAGLAAKELWSNSRTAVQFNTPVVKNGFVYGISTGGRLFCLDAKTGNTTWTADLKTAGRYVGLWIGGRRRAGAFCVESFRRIGRVRAQREGIQESRKLSGRQQHVRLSGDRR